MLKEKKSSVGNGFILDLFGTNSYGRMEYVIVKIKNVIVKIKDVIVKRKLSSMLLSMDISQFEYGRILYSGGKLIWLDYSERKMKCSKLQKTYC